MFSLRFGYNFYFLNYTIFVYGGENVSTHYLTAGVKINLSKTVEIEPRFEYLTTNLKDNELYKNDYGVYATLRFYEF